MRRQLFTLIELLACPGVVRSSGRSQVRATFTLIELLVVIAIIAILASLPATGDGLKRTANYLIADGHVVNLPMPPDWLCKNLNPGTNNTALFEWLSEQGVDGFANQRSDWPTTYAANTSGAWNGTAGWAYPW